VDYIAGTSIGSLVGAVYASGGIGALENVVFEVLITSSSIMESQITTTRLQTDPPDILIQPDLAHIKFLEYNRARETINLGYQEARVRLDLLLGQ
jgi:predicted acylesterase/phospholipase RssA